MVGKDKEVVEVDVAVGIKIVGGVPIGLRARQAKVVGEGKEIVEIDLVIAIEVADEGGIGIAEIWVRGVAGRRCIIDEQLWVPVRGVVVAADKALGGRCFCFVADEDPARIARGRIKIFI